jgi:VanZ family protein
MIWWLSTLGWAAVIFMFSTSDFGSIHTEHVLGIVLGILHLHLNANTLDTLNHLTRKLAHLTEYGIFANFLYHALSNGRNHKVSLRRAAIAIVIAGVYSLTDEFHQIFVPGRGPALHDSLLDTVGATLGIVLLQMFWWAIQAMRSRREARNAAAAPK